ncbi:hypothetical protein T492DRAFT_1015961, partial [Pavlovales sp. CCMP2436]
MVGLFWPLTFGLFWRGATEVGAGVRQPYATALARRHQLGDGKVARMDDNLPEPRGPNHQSRPDGNRGDGQGFGQPNARRSSCV